MARFKCCNLESVEDVGDPVWINLDLVKSIEVGDGGMGPRAGSRVNFLGLNGDWVDVSQSPVEIFSGPTIDA